MATSDTHRAIDAVWRIESARLIAGLARIVRDVGVAEDLAHDALVAALEQWPGSGVPDNPGAWLMAAAKHRAIDHLRRNSKPTTPVDDVPEAQLAVPGKEPAWIKIPEGLLSPRQALVLRMLYDRDLEVADVAKLLNVDPQTVRSMHHKALTRLRQHFAEEDGPKGPAGSPPGGSATAGPAPAKGADTGASAARSRLGSSIRAENNADSASSRAPK